jgi:nitrogen fixation/metabolism regulation signal transduction histidine kinase
MNSLRARLILGAALVAVIPLAVAMALMSQRIQATVRAQAAERLTAVLGILQSQVGEDARAIQEKVAILARDPDTRRLYLVPSASGRDLAEHLAEQQFLLGLDLLVIADSSGRVVADAATAPSALARAGRAPFPAGALDRVRGTGLALERVPGDSALVLAAAAPILYQGEPVGLVRGGTMLDARFLARLGRTSGVHLVLHDERGEAAAGTLPRGAVAPSPRLEGAERVSLAGRSHLAQSLAIDVGSGPRAWLTGLASTGAADETIAALRWTSLLLGLLGVGLAIALGALWSRQVSRPVERLAGFSERIARGEWDEPLALHSVRELETLVEALERMRSDLRGYRERLVASERQAAWSQMARKVAHEIKNPLTPIAISIADLKRSHDQRRPDFPEILDQAVRTVSEEVETLKRLLNEFSEFGRFPAPAFAACRVRDLAADLRTLYGRDVEAGRLAVAGPEGDPSLRADRGQLRQALVNLVKNGLEAVEQGGRVEVAMRPAGGALEITVADTGAGLSEEQRANLFVPGFTTKTHGSGLGLTIVERVVGDHGGTIAVESAAGRGTTFRIRLPLARGA